MRYPYFFTVIMLFFSNLDSWLAEHEKKDIFVTHTIESRFKLRLKTIQANGQGLIQPTLLYLFEALNKTSKLQRICFES